MRGRVHQSYGRLRQHRERALAAAEGAGEIGAVLGQQGVQRIAGDTARQSAGESGAQQRQMTRHQFPQPFRGAGRPRPAPGRSPALAEPQLSAPVRHDGQFPDVVRGRPPRHRVRAARVVADHSAERAAAVCGGVGAERQPVPARLVPQPVQHRAGLDHRRAGRRVDGDHRPHVAGEVQDDTGSGRLSGDRRSRSPGHHRNPVAAADGERGRDVRGVVRRDHAVRHPAVVGRVHRRQRPRPGREVHLAADLGPQRPFQLPAIRHRAISHGPSVPHARSGDAETRPDQ